MKPLLKSYVYFAPVASGIFFRGANVEFILKGKGIYAFLSKILAQFDGKQSLADIKQPLTENQQNVIDKMTAELLKQSMIYDNNDSLSVNLSNDEQKQFHVPLNYLVDKAPNGIIQFPSWREQKVAVIGYGPAQITLAESLLEKGIQNIWLLPLSNAGDIATLSDNNQEHINELNEVYHHVNGQIKLVDSWPQLNQLGVEHCLFSQPNLVNQDISSIMKKANLNESLISGLVTNIGNEQIVISANAIKQLANCQNFSNIEMIFDKSSVIQQQLSAAVLTQSFFESYFNIESQNDGITVIDDALNIDQHLLLPAQKAIDWHQDNSSDFLRSIEVLEDAKFGIVGKANGDDLPQLPLNVDKLEVKITGSRNEPSTHVIAWGHNLPDAKKQVLKRSLSVYLKNIFGQQCFSGFSERDAQVASISSLTAQYLSIQKSLTTHPLSLDVVKSSEIKKLVNIAAIYGAKFSTYQIENPVTGLIALGATLDGQHMAIVCGFDKERVLSELLAQLILAIQLPDEQYDNAYAIAIELCVTSSKYQLFSELETPLNISEVIEQAPFSWTPIANQPLRNLGLHALTATMYEIEQGENYVA